MVEILGEEVVQNLTEPQQAEQYCGAGLSIAGVALSKSGYPVEFRLGQKGQVDILGEPVTVLDYITKPINRVSTRVLTEH